MVHVLQFQEGSTVAGRGSSRVYTHHEDGNYRGHAGNGRRELRGVHLIIDDADMCQKRISNL